MSTSSGLLPLHRLASLHGVQTAYYDVKGKRKPAPWESMLAVLQSFGCPCPRLQDVPEALRHRQQEMAAQVMEPVIVAWNGHPPTIHLRLPASMGDAWFKATLDMETGERRSWTWSNSELLAAGTVEIEGLRYLTKLAQLPVALPWGYHHLSIEVASGPAARALIIAAPMQAYAWPGEERSWGIFLPLYALRSRDSWGTGSFSHLASMAQWVSDLGGSLVATLPLLPAFLDEPLEPSPYLPVSRLLWNELYVDLCQAASDEQLAAPLHNKLEALAAQPEVDYRSVMATKRRVLEESSRRFYTNGDKGLEALRRFVANHPAVESYACFRATMERQRAKWQSWPDRLRQGKLLPGDYADDIKNYYLYAQWLAHQQMDSASREARQKGVKLHLDLPLGVHPDGYDPWHHQELFVHGMKVGAPPDTFFDRGQDWGFPPLHPQAIRRDGYRYLIACVRHHLKAAGLLRLDHVMGLHRLFWIPEGMKGTNGVYVRYSAEELYAILALESHRYQGAIVGEDLGTVARETTKSMRRHGLYGMHVAYFNLPTRDRRAAPRPVPSNALASINTHDMPPFAAFYRGTDIPHRVSLGLQSKSAARQEQKERRTSVERLAQYLLQRGWSQGTDATEAMLGTLRYLSASKAPMLLVNLEDLWLETRPQNVPGTGQEQPNWRRKARYSLEEFTRMPQVVDALRQVDQLRRRSGVPA